jgi:dTDP-4-amino-4,6-dideoxygalactose transaminase
LEIGEDDVVWTSPNTFVASANCARYCGAKVDFVDIDEHSYNMSVAALEKKLLKAQSSDESLPSLLIVVHFAGQSCDMKGVKRLADRFGFKVIEDASHALGSTYLEKPVGSCEYSDACVFSFHPVKIVTSGEGGMVVTRSTSLAEKMRQLRTHGIVRNKVYDSSGKLEPWHYQQTELGYNYRLSDIHAALGLSQMSRLDEFIENRTRLAHRYQNLLQDSGLTLPYQSDYAASSYHLYPVLVPDQTDRKLLRNRLFHYLREAGIGVNVHYIPVHSQPYYSVNSERWGEFPVAEAYYERTLSLPLFSSLSNENQDRVIELLYNFRQQRVAA